MKSLNTHVRLALGTFITMLSIVAAPLAAQAAPAPDDSGATKKSAACISPQRGSFTWNINSGDGDLQGYLLIWSNGRNSAYEVGARNMPGLKPNIWWRVWATVGGTEYKYIDMYVADGVEERRHPCLPENATSLHLQGCIVGAEGHVARCQDGYWPV